MLLYKIHMSYRPYRRTLFTIPDGEAAITNQNQRWELGLKYIPLW